MGDVMTAQWSEIGEDRFDIRVRGKNEPVVTGRMTSKGRRNLNPVRQL
jgi:hypothetical protein